jgi:hypothetical protein
MKKKKENQKSEKFINWNDTSIPIGVRKVSYVKWAVSKGTSLIKAKTQANKKFGFADSDPAIRIIADSIGVHKYKRRINFDDYKENEDGYEKMNPLEILSEKIKKSDAESKDSS